MVILNVLFMLLSAKWVIDADKYTLAWFVGGICFTMNTLAVLTNLEHAF